MQATAKEKEPGKFEITVSGAISTDTVSVLEEVINKITADASPADVQFDFQDVEYIASSGLRVLLKLRKNKIPMRIINVSPEVYDIFDMTGFTAMFDIQKKFREFSIEGATVIGSGCNGTVYRINPEIVLKLYTKPDALEDIRFEQKHAKYALKAGIPTAISFDIVKVGNQYGSVFELLDTVSITNLLEKDAEQAFSYIPAYVELLHTMHEIPYVADPTLEMTDAAQKFKDYIQTMDEHGLPELATSLRKFADTIPVQQTMLHGDCQPGNVMITKDELLFIDMDTLSFGNPFYDLGYLYSTLVTYQKVPTIPSIFKVDADVLERFFHQTFDAYYADLSDEEKDHNMAICRIISCTQVLRNLLRHPERATDAFRAHAAGKLQELLNQYFAS